MTFIFNMVGAAVAGEGAPDPAPDEEVVVIATRVPRQQGDAPVAVEVVDREEIEASGAQDVADLLETHPGVEIRRTYLGAELRLRGLDPSRVLILVDGQRVVGRKGGSFDLSRIPAESVERIEIVKGPASALYGSDALGGVVNIVTRASRAPAADVTGRAGIPVAGDVTAGLGVRGLRLDGGIHLQDAVDLDATDVATDLDGTRQGDGALTASRRITDDVRIGAVLRGSMQDSSGVDVTDAGAVLDRRNLTEEWSAQLTSDVTPGERSRWTSSVGAGVYRDQYLLDQQGSGALDVYEETVEWITQGSSQVDAIVGDHRVTGGSEAFVEVLRTPRIEDGRGERARGAVFGQDEWTLGRCRLVPGLRLDVDSWFGAAMAPKLAIRIDPADTVVLRASVGSGWRAPSFRELLLRFDNSGAGYRITGNPELRPERSWSVSAGADWTPSEHLGVMVHGWYDQISGMIQIGDPSPGADGIDRYTYLNIDRALTAGGEATVSVSAGGSSLSLSGTATEARDLGTGDPLPGVAPLRGTSQARLGWSKAGFVQARVSVVSARPWEMADAEVVTAPAYALVDLRAEQGLAAFLELFVGVDNLADVGDPDILTVMPRFLYAGMTGRLRAKETE